MRGMSGPKAQMETESRTDRVGLAPQNRASRWLTATATSQVIRCTVVDDER